MIDGLMTYRGFRKAVPDLAAFDDAHSIRIYRAFLIEGIKTEHRLRGQLSVEPVFLAEWVADSPLEEAETAIRDLDEWLANKGLTP